MNKNPLEIIQKLDNELYENIIKTREMTFKEGALSIKTKLLIAIALDASKGAQDGVKNLVSRALKAGIVKDEIMEAIRIANYICGASSVYPSAYALKELF